MMKGKKSLIFAGIVIVIILAALGIIFLSSNKVNKDETKGNDAVSVDKSGDSTGVDTQGKTKEWIEGLSLALKEKKMVMYGAYWCSHCQNQKKTFGDSFKNIDYVECDAEGPNANPDECAAQDIKGYPTWIYNGEKYSGEQTFDKLAQIIGYEGN